MAALCLSFHHHINYNRYLPATYGNASISCSMQQTSSNNIKVVINGATKDIGKAAIVAVTKARGMEIAGAIDSDCIGQDAGIISNMEEALEIPILNDLTVVLGSIAQSKGSGVVVDFTEPSTVYDNVKQAAAFGLSSVVYVPKLDLETVTALSLFCEKASMGCLVAPTLSIGSVLLQQAAIQASFHFKNVEIVESRPNPFDLPSQEANQIATNLSGLGQIYNKEDFSTDIPTEWRRAMDWLISTMLQPCSVNSTRCRPVQRGTVSRLESGGRMLFGVIHIIQNGALFRCLPSRIGFQPKNGRANGIRRSDLWLGSKCSTCT